MNKFKKLKKSEMKFQIFFFFKIKILNKNIYKGWTVINKIKKDTFYFDVSRSV